MSCIALVGLAGAGKASVANYLVTSHGYRLLSIKCNTSVTSLYRVNNIYSNSSNSSNSHSSSSNNKSGGCSSSSGSSSNSHSSSSSGGNNTSDPNSSDSSEMHTPSISFEPVELDSLDAFIDYITKNWRENFVVTCLHKQSEIEALIKRPFFMVAYVDASSRTRYERCLKNKNDLTLQELIDKDDQLLYGNGYMHIRRLAKLTILNNGTLTQLEHLIDSMKFGPLWNRPSWDNYFMEMADLASKRSNCMKRGVGCVIVKDKRVISTGYNGTARGTVNCCDGGCKRCNENTPSGLGLNHCFCLHAEENALLEAGRARTEAATLYCTTAPCLGCAQKIVQCGISRIVYAREYNIEHITMSLLTNVEVLKLSNDNPVFAEATKF